MIPSTPRPTPWGRWVPQHHQTLQLLLCFLLLLSPLLLLFSMTIHTLCCCWHRTDPGLVCVQAAGSAVTASRTATPSAATSPSPPRVSCTSAEGTAAPDAGRHTKSEHAALAAVAANECFVSWKWPYLLVVSPSR